MTIRETIFAEVDEVPDQELDDLLKVVRDFKHRSDATASDKPVNGSAGEARESIFDKMLKHTFKGPRDLSENFELYASGEKRFDDEADVH